MTLKIHINLKVRLLMLRFPVASADAVTDMLRQKYMFAPEFCLIEHNDALYNSREWHLNLFVADTIADDVLADVRKIVEQPQQHQQQEKS